jgi:hypothetical protein
MKLIGLFACLAGAAVLVLPVSAQTGPTCPLYGNSAQCSGYTYAAPQFQMTPAAAVRPQTTPETQEQQNYETGQAAGSAFGRAMFYKLFPGWRRRYCSARPGEPFLYGNASGDQISGTCSSQNQLADEAATEWMAKHLQYRPSAENGAAMDKFIADNRLPRWEPKSYDKAFKGTKTGKLAGN